jgi:hypothetical protein
MSVASAPGDGHDRGPIHPTLDHPFETVALVTYHAPRCPRDCDSAPAWVSSAKQIASGREVGLADALGEFGLSPHECGDPFELSRAGEPALK